MYKKLYLISLYLTIIILFNVFLLPLSPRMPGPGLDESWIYVNSYAFEKNLKYGSDIIFTYGPLSSFSFGRWNILYNPQYYYLYIFLSFISTSLIAIGITNHILKANAVVGLISLLSIFIAITNGISYYFVIPFLFSIYVIRKDKLSKILVYTYIFLSAYSSLIKFSYFLPILLVILVYDCYFFVKYRRLQFHTLTFVVFFIFLYVLAGQDLSDIGLYIKGSLEIAKGHSEAMQVSGPKEEIYYWLSIIFIGTILPLFIYLKEKNLDKTLVLSSFLIILFMMFKAGFVRHDGAHNITAFAGLNYFFGFMIPLTFQKKTSKTHIEGLLTLAIISIFLSVELNAKPIGPNTDARYINHHTRFISNYRSKFFDGLNKLRIFYKDEYQEELLKRYKQSIDNLKKALPLQKIEGTIDIYPWNQAYILANNLEYKPRPVFQSNVVYTEYLLKRNIEFLRSESGPANILFKIEALDDHLPALMEGPSWLEILRQYKMENMYGNFLHLIKDKRIDRSYTLIKFLEKEIHFGEKIDLPDEIKGDLVYANFRIEKRFLGKILNLLYKLPSLYIILDYQNGSSRRVSIIPEISKTGFILSPDISDVYDFVKLSSNNSFFPESKRVKSLRFESDHYIDLFYKNVDVTFNRLKLKDVGTININVSNFKNLFILYEMLSKTISPHSPIIRSHNNRPMLFTSMPSKTTLSLNNNKKINFKYGILERAYTEGSIHSACFKISVVYARRHKDIWKKCIDPKRVEQDKGTQYVSLNIDDDAKELIFETVANGTGDVKRGWTYWSDISIE